MAFVPVNARTYWAAEAHSRRICTAKSFPLGAILSGVSGIPR